MLSRQYTRSAERTSTRPLTAFANLVEYRSQQTPKRMQYSRKNEPGTPLSRLNDHSIRELAASAATVVLICIMTTIEDIKAAPEVLPVACSKMVMNGYPVGLCRAAVMSSNVKVTARRMANPRRPLSPTLKRMDRGTTREASRISSACIDVRQHRATTRRCWTVV